MKRQLNLIYNPNDEQTVQEKILPALNNSTVITLVPFKQDDPSCSLIENECWVVTYLNDENLSEIISGASLKKWTVGFLPHPDMKEARQGYGISGNILEAIEDIENAEKGIKADLLLCNGRPVFNAVVIGNTLSLMSGSVAKSGFFSSLEKLKHTILHLNLLIPRAFTITTENKEPIKTAALGIVAVLHGKSTLLSRQIIKGSFINDGRLHALILAPRSIMELLRFSVNSVFRDRNNRKLPSFIGHIKAPSITISSPEPMDFSQDNNLMSAKEIELVVSDEKLIIIPGRYLKTDEEAGEPTENYKVNALPKGEAYLKEIVAKPLSLIYHASTEEFKELFKVLRENSKPNSSYLTLMVLSTLLATFGLFSNSSPVIIGAMILAPLMAPIISLSMGVLRQDRKLILESAKTIGLGILLGYIASFIITQLTPLQTETNEISARIRPNLLDLGVAIVSGIAGAYAHAREEVAKTLAGVAIAVALVPPLAVSGIGIGWADWQVFFGALLLFLTNLAGIVLAGSFSFLLLGFSPFHLARKGLIISFLIVVIVSFPLGYGFFKMVKEHNIVQSLENYHVNGITLKQISVVRGSEPLVLNITLVSDYPIKSSDITEVKKAITSKVGREVQLEVQIRLRR